MTITKAGQATRLEHARVQWLTDRQL